MLSVARLEGQAARLAHRLSQTSPAVELPAAQEALAYAHGFDSWSAMTTAHGGPLDWSAPVAVLQAARAAGATRVHLRPSAAGASIAFVIDNKPQPQVALTLMQAHTLLMRLGGVFGLTGQGLETVTAPFLDEEGRRFEVTCSAQSQTLNFLFVLSDGAQAALTPRATPLEPATRFALPPDWAAALQRSGAGLYVVASESASAAAELLEATAQSAAQSRRVGHVRTWDVGPEPGQSPFDVLVVHPEIRDLFSMEKVRGYQALAKKVILWVRDDDASEACRRLTHRFQPPAGAKKVRIRAVVTAVQTP